MEADCSHRSDDTRDTEYTEILLTPLRECRYYRPAFGQDVGEGVSIAQFRTLYGGDPLYRWVGLDDDLMYAAHKAAGGMTSLYRQLGVGCERLVRQVILNSLRLSDEQVSWSYQYDKGNGETAVHTLDARITISDLEDRHHRRSLQEWLRDAADDLHLGDEVKASLRGVILEIRQGYKSADSKRQNADLRFGLRAYTDAAHLPVIAIVSTQASDTVCRRYRSANLMVLKGNLVGMGSTFSFLERATGYDLAGFFERNSPRIRGEFIAILRGLLHA